MERGDARRVASERPNTRDEPANRPAHASDVSLLEDFETHRRRLDVERASAHVTLPWLVVHGEADTTVPVTEAHRLIGANPRARLEIIQDAGHTFEARHPFAGTTPALNQALLATRRHFERHLSSRVDS